MARARQARGGEEDLPRGPVPPRAAPPALRIAILRGVAAQHAREGRALPEHVVRRMHQGEAV
eukprot:6706245-Alexandrium_andersonii.AAC.1